MGGNLFRFADVNDVVTLQTGRTTDEKDRIPIKGDVDGSAEDASGDIKQVDVARNQQGISVFALQSGLQGVPAFA